MKSPIVKTENYILRPFTKSDALLWQKWDIDEEVQAYMPEPKNVAVSLLEQEQYLCECEQDPEGYYWSIEVPGVKAIGTVSLTEIDEYHKTAELGILLGDRDYWGKGVATEVVKNLVSHSFSHLSLEYISAEVEEGNTPMEKVFQKAGFRKDGIFEGARIKNGVRIRVFHFSILKNSMGK